MNFLDWCGLKYRADLHEIDLGYRLKEKAEEKDMQPKPPMPQFDMALKEFVLQPIVGRAKIDNVASWKMLEEAHDIYG